MGGPAYARADLRRFALAERARVRATLVSLSPDQWATSSLCAGWTVRHVAGHVASAMRTSVGGFLAGAVRERFDLDRLNDLNARRMAAYPDDALLAAFEGDRMNPLHWLLPGLPLLDLVVHHQDIRRPLGLETVFPGDHLRACLQLLTTSRLFGRLARQAPGHRLVATDLDWSYGSGTPEVRGPAEALLMALMDRPVGPEELSGVELLRAPRGGE
ncbi:maleylpyruvate isomerase family mycothiol-dependent enzyme [Actinopolymorpha alba]|uniref:maleylpyruvate isomerase family mycothiol-dependent enzyme n=1 Tax=Actinopolymorpha alba TaxID=533267 RepID=UPI00037D45CD|nr:maleylpyruvate isomerase family mycothiol-dependent enzyme [Actinopolymorpha alba]